MADSIVYPRPMLDLREKDLLIALQKDFEKFIAPGPVKRTMRRVGKVVSSVTPDVVKKTLKHALDSVTDLAAFQQAVQLAGQGFQILTGEASHRTLSRNAVVRALSARGNAIVTFDQICALRSYRVEEVANSERLPNLTAAAIEGAGTGFFGLPAVPVNIVTSFFLYFRAAQSIALDYGYDVKNDPRELQIAAEIVIQSLEPDFTGGGLPSILSKMMLSANLDVLGRNLSRKTLTELAKNGGSELLYVQIRALASKAAKKALEKAERDGLEVGIFKGLMEAIAVRIPKDSLKKMIPVLSAVLGGFTDTYLMHRVIRGANMIYHKRFLMEKKHRNDVLFNRGNDE